MDKIADQLANALRELESAPPPCDCGIQGCGERRCSEDRRLTAHRNAREALAAYEAQHSEAALSKAGHAARGTPA